MTNGSAGISEQLNSRIWWRIIPLMGLVMMMNYLDRSNVSFASLGMNKALNFTPQIFGLGVTVFFVGYILMMLPSNYIVQRVGARRWLAFLIVGWGLASMSTVAVAGANQFFLNRFVLGVLEAGFQPGVLYFLTLWFTSRHRASATAWFMVSGTFVGILGSPLSAALLAFDGMLGLDGWQWLFLIEGAPSVLLGCLVYFYLADRPATAKWLSAQEVAELSAALDDERGVSTTEQPSVRQTLARREVQFLAASYFFIGLSVWTLVFWAPQIIQQLAGTDNLSTGLLAALPYAASTVAVILIGRSSDRRNERRWHVALTMLVGTVGMLIVALGSQRWTVVPGLCLASIGVFSFIGPFWAFVSDIVHPRLRASVIAIVGVMGPLGGAVGPYGVGWIREYSGSFHAAMMACAVAQLIATLLVLFAPRSAPAVRPSLASA